MNACKILEVLTELIISKLASENINNGTTLVFDKYIVDLITYVSDNGSYLMLV